MATIKSKVLAQLGQNNTSYLDDVTDTNDVFDRGYWAALNMLPPRLLLSHIVAPINPEDQVADTDPNTELISTLDISDKKELMVFRTSANHIMNQAAIETVRFITKPCKRITLENSKKALDSESIYYATSNSPVYWFDNYQGNQVIKTAPVTTGWTNTGSAAYMPNSSSALQIYAVKRYAFTNADLHATTGLESFPLTNALGTDPDPVLNLPEEVEGLVVKKIAHTFLIELIANANVQDEDSELATILSTESQILSEVIANEVKELTERFQEG